MFHHHYYTLFFGKGRNVCQITQIIFCLNFQCIYNFVINPCYLFLLYSTLLVSFVHNLLLSLQRLLFWDTYYFSFWGISFSWKISSGIFGNKLLLISFSLLAIFNISYIPDTELVFRGFCFEVISNAVFLICSMFCYNFSENFLLRTRNICCRNIFSKNPTLCNKYIFCFWYCICHIFL